MDSTNIYNSTKYNDIKKDSEEAGWRTKLFPFEIGSRGLVSKRNKIAISQIQQEVKIKTMQKALFIDMSQIALLCSFST